MEEITMNTIRKQTILAFLQKTNALELKPSTIIMVFCALTFLFASLEARAAQTNDFTFVNNDDTHATDLHIQFSQAVDFVADPANPDDITYSVPHNTFHQGDQPSTNIVDLIQGSGNGVDPGNSVTLSFSYAGGTLNAVSWYWTHTSVPTLSEWGLIAMGLLLLTVGTIFIRKYQAVLSPAGGTMAAGHTRGPLFASSLYFRVLAAVMALVLLGVGAVIWRSGTISATDLAGALLCASIAAYWVHLLLLWRNGAQG
jgi:hypothetical protein